MSKKHTDDTLDSIKIEKLKEKRRGNNTETPTSSEWSKAGCKASITEEIM